MNFVVIPYQRILVFQIEVSTINYPEENGLFDKLIFAKNKIKAHPENPLLIEVYFIFLAQMYLFQNIANHQKYHTQKEFTLLKSQ